MKKEQNMQNQLGILACFFEWAGRHKTLTNVILWIEIIALVWAVFTYNFTTKI